MTKAKELINVLEQGEDDLGADSYTYLDHLEGNYGKIEKRGNVWIASYITMPDSNYVELGEFPSVEDAKSAVESVKISDILDGPEWIENY